MPNGQNPDNARNVVNNLLNAPAALTFPVCVALATALWTVLKLFGDWANAGYVGVVSCVVIGVCLYVIDILHTQPDQNTPLTPPTYVLRGIFAFFNVLLLAVTVVQVTEPAVSG
jgi:hypothetical protein